MASNHGHDLIHVVHVTDGVRCRRVRVRFDVSGADRRVRCK